MITRVGPSRVIISRHTITDGISLSACDRAFVINCNFIIVSILVLVHGTNLFSVLISYQYMRL